jgi:hypothetical protein
MVNKWNFLCIPLTTSQMLFKYDTKETEEIILPVIFIFHALVISGRKFSVPSFKTIFTD